MLHTLKEARSMVLESLGMTTDIRIQPEVVDRELNRAQHQINLEYQIVQSEWTATSVAQKILYILPKRLLRLGRVYFDDEFIVHDADLSLEDIEDQEDPQPVTWTEAV